MRRGALGADPADTTPSHVVVLASSDATVPLARRRLQRSGSGSEPARAADYAMRATIIDVTAPLTEAAAESWMARAGEAELEHHISVLNAMLYAHRLAAADPQLPMLDRRQALAARVGIGAGDQLVDGRFSEVRELHWQAPQRPRRRMLTPEGRLAAILTGREQPLVCEELVLRARADVDGGRDRHAALQLLVALDAAIAELAGDPTVTQRVEELRLFREPVGAAAQAALSGDPDEAGLEAVRHGLERIEAALRARAAARR